MQHCPMSGLLCPLCTSSSGREFEKGPSQQTKDLVAEINERSRHGKLAVIAEYYLQYDSDGPNQWRIKITIEGEVEIEYLVPENVNAHTIMLMIDAARKWGDLRFKAGKEDAVNKLSQHFMGVVK